MPDKGKVMTQVYYDKQNRLYELTKESFIRKAMSATEAIAVLRILGFSNSIANVRVNEWTVQPNSYTSETITEKNRRQKQQVSLEK